MTSQWYKKSPIILILTNVCLWRRVKDKWRWHFNYTVPYDFHFTPSTNVHWYIKFRQFFSISAEKPLSSPVSCLRLLSPVSCLLSLVSCLLSPVFYLLSHVPCLLSHVSHAVSAADLIYDDIADLAILWSKFADLGNLAILTLLVDLADWKQIHFSGYEV